MNGYLYLLEGKDLPVHHVPGPVHDTELALPNLLLHLEVPARGSEGKVTGARAPHPSLAYLSEV